MQHKPKYRPEIDGLRALAILPVVFFHYRIPHFEGGFVGVDVFFVISGYLITSLIAGEMDADGFSILKFYERRIRRIFPALFAMLAAATAAACYFLFPEDLVRYSKSLAATAGFVSNFEFWREAGYFDVASDQKPLLHLWSIAVEEQFYLVFPGFLILLQRIASRWPRTDRPPLKGEVGSIAKPAPEQTSREIGIVALLALSLAFSVWGVGHAKEAAFYLLPSRAWELMLGALLATGTVPQIGNFVAREVLAVTGLGLVGASAYGFDAQMPFPGALALVPCIGTALVIHCAGGGKSIVGQVLSIRPLVFVGLISYSLYLWHWPLYVFAKYVFFHDLSVEWRVGLIAASFAAAILSWRFVERPFRRSVARRTLFPAAATAMAVTFVAGVVAASADGFPERLPQHLQRILAEQDDHEPRLDQCFPMTASDVEAGRLCTIGAEAAKPSFLLWGDSHADAIVPPVDGIAKRTQHKGYLAGGASCVPLAGVTTPMASCRPFNDAVMKLALAANVSDVILEARWAKYADGATYGDEPRGHILLRDDQTTGSPPDNHAVFARGLERTVRALVGAGKHVTLVASVPEVGWPVPAVLARRALAHGAGDVDVSFDKYMQRQSFVMAEFARLQKLYGVNVVYPHEILCAKQSCAVSLDGIPLYRDEHHLSVYGALKLEPLMRGIL